MNRSMRPAPEPDMHPGAWWGSAGQNFYPLAFYI
jgi:hypothetical protein